MNKFIYIHGYKLVLTCFACPEQYDVFDPEGTQVGHIHLKRGTLRVHYPDYGGRLLFETKMVNGDGIFDVDERYQNLCHCVELIQRSILTDMFSTIYADLPDNECVNDKN